MADGHNAALRAVSDAVLAVAPSSRSRRSSSASSTGRASWPGPGTRPSASPTAQGGFARFLVSGMTDELIAAMGPLPRTHGLLGAMLETPRRRSGPTTSTSTRASTAGGPPATPTCTRSSACRSSSPDGVIGAFYLTEKVGAPAFDADDQELIELLAAHAAIAITNARLYERSRELTIVAERNRLALDLHDVVSQKLFGLVLGRRVGADPARPRRRPATPRPRGGARPDRARRRSSAARPRTSCAR